MPAEYPDYPSWREVRDYVWNMAKSYDLTRSVSCGVSVDDATPVRAEGGSYWRVTLSTGDTRRYRGVVYAGGQQWAPFTPDIPGLSNYTGRAIHSSQYRSTEEFRDKRVLVIGAGNSGVDIAADAALTGRHAILSTRRPYHFFPKSIFGVPTSDLVSGRISLPDLPMFANLSKAQQLDLVLATVGDLTRYGLPAPDSPVGSTHPIVSDTILHCFTHGLLRYKPDVSHVEADTVHFADGTAEPVDVIVTATGYDLEVPWLADGLIKYEQGHAKFHLGTFADGLPGFYGVGVLHAAVAEAWALFDQFAQLMAADANATLTGRNAENLRRVREEYSPDLTGGFPFLATRRNVNQSDAEALRTVLDELRTEYDIEIPNDDDMSFYALPPTG